MEFELEGKWPLSLHWEFAPAVLGCVWGGGCCFLWDLLSSLDDLNREWPRCTHVGSDAEVSRAWTQTPR